MMFEMKTAGLTDTGRTRTNNEDTFLIDDSLLIVADGMGGAAAGEVASSLAVNVIKRYMKDISYTSDKRITQHFEMAILKADSEIKKLTKEKPELSGMGTTIMSALHINERLLLGYVGDSRAYLITPVSNVRASKKGNEPKIDMNAETAVLKKIDDDYKPSEKKSIRRMTSDHSVVMDLVNSGVINEDEIRTHPLRNRITRCVGNLVGPGPDFIWHNITDGDTVILCSDGLWEMIYDDLILAIISSSTEPKEICKRLIDAANNAGGVDNITVIAAQFKKKN
ncbi:MAG: serine/threonine-protein phosphatase [Candidatus Latescibacteria bacterium]|nr:serine/threonine-protein phosphatase [Candidatus Latescibacterota bacterium]